MKGKKKKGVCGVEDFMDEKPKNEASLRCALKRVAPLKSDTLEPLNLDEWGFCVLQPRGFVRRQAEGFFIQCISSFAVR